MIVEPKIAERELNNKREGYEKGKKGKKEIKRSSLNLGSQQKEQLETRVEKLHSGGQRCP